MIFPNTEKFLILRCFSRFFCTGVITLLQVAALRTTGAGTLFPTRSQQEPSSVGGWPRPRPTQPAVAATWLVQWLLSHFKIPDKQWIIALPDPIILQKCVNLLWIACSPIGISRIDGRFILANSRYYIEWFHIIKWSYILINTTYSDNFCSREPFQKQAKHWMSLSLSAAPLHKWGINPCLVSHVEPHKNNYGSHLGSKW